MCLANDKNTDVHLHDWSGSPFEIGRQHGSALRDEIITETGGAANALAGRLQCSLPKALESVVSLYEPLFREHLPIAIEEIEGIAAGSGLSYPFVFFGATRDGMKVPVTAAQAQPDQCTSFVCGKPTTLNGKMLIGQTKDTGLYTGRFKLMRYNYADGRRLVVLNYPGWVGNLGLTSDGMALTGNALYAQEACEDIVPYSFLKRLVLEKSSTEEVLQIISGLSFANGCFLIADATGHAVCIESVAGQLDIRDVSGTAFGHANSVLSNELKRFEDPWTRIPSSPPRQKNIQRLLDEKRGQITVDVLKQITADHADYPYSVCRHPDEADPLATSAGAIMDLSALEMHVALGNPCKNDFHSYRL